MNVQQLVSDFLASERGQQASQALTSHGFSADDTRQMLRQVAAAAHTHAAEQNGGLMGEHSGKSFLAAFAAGLARGDGFFKSLVEGGEGILTGRVAESLADKVGIDPSTASTVAAAATPYVIAFLKERLA